jgi:hypothetical protein
MHASDSTTTQWLPWPVLTATATVVTMAFCQTTKKPTNQARKEGGWEGKKEGTNKQINKTLPLQ